MEHFANELDLVARLGISVLALLVGVAGSYLIRKIIDNKRSADSVSPESSLKFTPLPDPEKVRIEAGQSLWLPVTSRIWM
jgi:hypothetical protein